jgi:hypothetical protein
MGPRPLEPHFYKARQVLPPLSLPEIDAPRLAADVRKPWAMCGVGGRAGTYTLDYGALASGEPNHGAASESVQEVAAIVGIPCATVKTRMFYARKKLAALLAAERVTGAAA